MKFCQPSNRLKSSIIAVPLLLLAGCGAGTSSGVTTTSPTYLFTAAPNYQWIQQFGANNLYTPPGFSMVTTETITKMATDTSGNVYASGYDLGSFNGASNPKQVAENFIIKFDSNGVAKWTYQFGTGAGDFLQSIGIDASGNVYATGITLGALPGYTNPTGASAGTLYKFNSSGSLIWQEEFTADGAYTSPSSLTIDPSGSIILGGIYSPASNKNAADLFFQKIDATSGSLIWQTTLGASATDSFNMLTSDANGDVYAIGTTTGAFPGQSTGSSFPFLLKLANATGSQLWVSSISVSGMTATAPMGVAVQQGQVIVSGITTNGLPTIGPAPDANEKGFLSAFSTTSGTSTWSKVISSGQGDEITGVAATSNGNIYAVGYTNGMFASGFTQPAQNMMLLKFATDGTALTAAQLGTGMLVDQTAIVGPQITISTSGQVYMGGPVITPFPGFSNTAKSLQMYVARFN